MKLLELATALLSSFLPSLRLQIGQAPIQPEPTSVVPSIPLDLTHLFNNIAVGPRANFDHHYEHSWAPEFMPSGLIEIGGVEFFLPQTWNGDKDNVVADRQVLPIPPTVGFSREMQILYAGDWIDGESRALFQFHFEDGSTQLVEASIHNWWNLHWINSGAAISADPSARPYHYARNGAIDYNITQLYTWTASVNSASPLKAITLPGLDWNRLHIFALSLIRSETNWPYEQPLIAIRHTRFTTKWRMIENQRALAVETVIANVLPSTLSADLGYWVKSRYVAEYTSDLFRTIKFGEFQRLMPGDQLVVKVWVVPKNRNLRALDLLSSEHLAHGEIRVRDDTGSLLLRQTASLHSGDHVDLLLRDTPEWWDDARFGIFMHWGIYSVPGWAPPGVYSEWYWWHQHHVDYDHNSFWSYHRRTHGEDFLYDHFIPRLGGKFNASAIMGLVAGSGARYFVPTTMHHDGFAIFDTLNATKRSSVYLGPKRDFLDELFEAAKAEQPHIHRGTYFSMPEWYNPNKEPYTGSFPDKHWLRDEQLEKMRILLSNTKPKSWYVPLFPFLDLEQVLMVGKQWCDIGGPNLTRTFLEEWLPFADAKGLQITMNNRCGAYPQFDTPEYAKFSSIQTSKWESSESVDPYSYGYNRWTQPNDYRSPTYLIHTLIDIVSKNGNYLLNIGPDGDGVVPPPVAERLLAIGSWLQHSGECIYGTASGISSLSGEMLAHLRMSTYSTFCIISLDRPHGEIVMIDTPIPLLQNDTISLLGAGTLGENLHWANHNGKYTIKVPNAALDKAGPVGMGIPRSVRVIIRVLHVS
ncbi:glycoside hydrolase family 29 protein [Hydnum rufescens UP504]|uniref:alpha-L-fucosidase n=1 Tax=Hydnum rufescens UP504 TaxID=1448309 RepID=A0A9P6B3L7_9AGAM|nr:glycoside hydrolase family 29 protein [Hydnum rufescens UP504]